jgi:DNA-binding response OmpR family regulator
MVTPITHPVQIKVLLVDDNFAVLSLLKAVLEIHGFAVTTAANVQEAIHLIDVEPFDVLLCDLHMPGAGDGFTVVSAMRHINPMAITLVFTGYPALKEAMNAILLQADEILLKPMAIPELIEIIQTKLRERGSRKPTNIERVAVILGRDSQKTIDNWLGRIEREPELTAVQLSPEERTGHLPTLIEELVKRLNKSPNLGTKAVCLAAVEHGKIRHSQGYTVAMLVEESRVLQVSIFETLQNNLSTVDFSLVLLDVMTIADEVDSQLKQTIVGFLESQAEATVAA